ncbi:MAG: DUF4160 domain-containing protein [Gallionella sp.]|nr:DUF4160 domain-containing protein [Gallionella sp.]
MPTISMFYGILVAILFEDNDRHNLPHIHVCYAGAKASISIEGGEVLIGDIPPKQLKMIQAWIEIHKDEFSPIGNLLLRVSSRFVLHRFNKENICRSCLMLLALKPARIISCFSNLRMAKSVFSI